MGQQYYIKTEQCERIHELGYIKSDVFNDFVNLAISEKIERNKKVRP